MRITFLLCFFLITTASKAQYQTQLDLANNFTDGNYTVYRNDQGKLDKVAKLWPISIVRTGNVIDKIIVKRAGVVDEEYIPDIKEAPGYFFYEDYRLVFTSSLILCYKQRGSGYEVGEFEIAFEFINDSGSKPIKFDQAKEYLVAYRKATLANQSSSREVISKNKEAAELKEREEHSLKGKTIKSLSFKAVDVPSNIGHFQKIEFGVIATLQNGKELKTKNIGGKTDFEFSYDISAPGCSFANGVLEVGGDASLFPNDEIVITIKNLHNLSQSIQQKILLTYNTPIFINSTGGSGNAGSAGSNGSGNVCSGKPGSNGQIGQDGKNYMIKFTETKHKKTGAKLYAAEIVRVGESTVFKIKIDPTTQVNINTSGGKGGSGGSGGGVGAYVSCKNGGYKGGNGGDGGMGGRGGNIMLTKTDKNIPTSVLVINNKGGDGGQGGSGGSGASSGSNGRAGTEGKVDITVSGFTFSWQ
ncbi:MAG: hypothetical protein RIR12_979 [Bacteroidota bacterium]|jgi:hypothetical protein